MPNIDRNTDPHDLAEEFLASHGRPGQDHYIAETDETGLGAVDAVKDESAPSSQWAEAWRYLRKRPLFWVASVMILIALLLALFPSIFTSVDPRSCSLANSLNPAESGHIFGFDRQGCDIYARVIYGARASVLVGVLTTALVTVVGALIGSIAGFFGGWVDTILSRITDIFFAIPLVLAAIVAATMSSASGNMIGTATMFTNDVFRPYINKGQKDDTKEIWISRVVMVLAGCVAWALLSLVPTSSAS